MTEKQALSWARKRYGKNAMVSSRETGPEHDRRRIGVVELGMFFAIRGSGPNWQAACDDAVARDARLFGTGKKSA